MPLYAIFSDVHSNLVALDAVLADCEKQGVTSYFCLGDVIGYGPQPGECLRKVRALGCPVLKGNHEYMAGRRVQPLSMNPMARAGIRYSREHLTPEEKAWISELPYVVRVPKMTLVHSSLEEPEQWHYIFGPEDAQSTLEQQRTSLCFYGHTHVPALFSLGEKYQPEEKGHLKFHLPSRGKFLVNCGSVGQPRNGDPRAQYALFDASARVLTFRQVDYDIEKTVKLIEKAGLPDVLGKRLLVGM